MKKYEVDQGYYMYDVVEDGPPPVGAHVQACGAGGKTVEIVWTSDSHKFFYAWSRFPKLKPSTKQRMMKQYEVKNEA